MDATDKPIEDPRMLAMCVLDVLRHDIEDAAGVARMVNLPPPFGWRDILRQDVTEEQVVDVLGILCAEGHVEQLAEEGEPADAGSERWFRITESGRRTWESWSPPSFDTEYTLSPSNDAFVTELVLQEPALNDLLQSHLEDYGELLPYLFLADVRRAFVAAAESDPAYASRLAALIDRGWDHEDSDVRDLVGITFGEDLAGDDTEGVRRCLTERMLRKLEPYRIGPGGAGAND